MTDLSALLHHACPNESPGLGNPTSERLSTWIWARLKPDLPELSLPERLLDQASSRCLNSPTSLYLRA